MQIREMFSRDIDRYINGVVSVGDEAGVAQELDEYVVTRELERHFATFFDAFERGLDSPERNTGVWVQGYFGSGKSHFLKMLSYLLENRVVAGRPAVDYFEGKFADQLTFARVRRAATKATTETILFNIDELGAGYKEGETSETAVLHAVARAFYEHLGFFGQDYKLARFEKMLDDRGKTEAFRAAYREVTGEDWLEDRDTYDMHGDEVAEAANRAAGLSIGSIADWADSTDATHIQIGDLVGDIDEYARRREAECGQRFRLVFMIDEMGQYLNGNVGRMLNLQTLVEQFCTRCRGRVWMVVTSQEAIDEMVSVVSTDFSKIQGRFGTRLSLSSSSVDEVIKRRILDKNGHARVLLAEEYRSHEAVLHNLFAFEGSRGDLRGYATPDGFVDAFPFVGYQFTLMPDVLKEVRLHGYQGKSLSTGERSMLSCYQEATQAVEGLDETALVPFWRFFDTLERELDHGVRQVFDRCRRAAEAGDGLHLPDVDVLKALYLIHYLSDVRPTAGNVAILMVDDIDQDMAALREATRESLERLVRENYVARNGDRYSFLTDEEQDVAREIRAVQPEPSDVRAQVASIVFEDILKGQTHYKKGANDFPFDRYVDDAPYGARANGMRLEVATAASSDQLPEAADAVLDLRSQGRALVVLDRESDYYDVLSDVVRVERYVRSNNKEAMSASKRRIVEGRQEAARAARKEGADLVAQAILHGRVSVDGHALRKPAPTAAQRLADALDELVGATFTKAELVDAPLADDAQLRRVLAGTAQQGLGGAGANARAAAEMDQWLAVRTRTYQPTTMEDVQHHFQAQPYGWREIDVAGVMAALWQGQRATLSYGGQRVSPTDPKALDYLRNQRQRGKVEVRQRRLMPQKVTADARHLLLELDGAAQVPDDEDGLVAAVAKLLEARREKLRQELRRHWPAGADWPYPGRDVVERGAQLAGEVLDERADPETFLRAFGEAEGDLLDNEEDLGDVRDFFGTRQVEFFDEAAATMRLLRQEHGYVEGDAAVRDALAQMQGILQDARPYRRLQQLPALTKAARDAYDRLVDAKRRALLDVLAADGEEVERYAADEGSAAPAAVARVTAEARRKLDARRSEAHAAETCSKLDALASQELAWKDACLRQIDAAVADAAARAQAARHGETSADAPATDRQGGATPSTTAQQGTAQPAPVPHAATVQVLSRTGVFPTKVLRSEEDVDAYLARAREALVAALAKGGGVRVG